MTTTENVRAHLAPEAGEGASAYVDPLDIGDAILEVYDDHEPRIASLEASGNVGTSDLADSAVTTAKIADSAVTSAKIADSAVTSAKIADGTIVNADVAPAAAIDVSKLSGAVASATVGNLLSSNQATGTDTLSDTTGFYLGSNGSSLASSATYAWQGTRSASYVAGGTASAYMNLHPNGSPAGSMTAVTPGLTYTGVAMLRATAADTLRMELWWYNSGGASIGSSTGASITASTSAWTRATVSAAAPAGAAYAQLSVHRQSGTAGSTVYGDGFGLWLGAGGDWQLPGVPITGTLSSDAVPKTLYDANTVLYATTDDTPAALTVGASTVVGRASTGGIAALTGTQLRTITGLATTDSPTFAGATLGASTVGSAPTVATVDVELGDGVSLTQNLTGLTVGGYYAITPVSGTLTGVTVDGVAQSVIYGTTGFKATATSHSFVGTSGTCTAISVKKVIPRVGGTASTVSGARISMYSANIYIGLLPLQQVASADYNTGFGYGVLSQNVSGSHNVAFGVNALAANTNGVGNTAVGSYVLQTLTSGGYNVGFGYSSLMNATTAGANSAYGTYSLAGVTSGTWNSGIGHSAGRAWTTGQYNSALGAYAGYTATTATVSGTVTIGVDSIGTAAGASADNEFVLGVATHNVRVAGSFNMQGGQQVKVATKSADYTLTASDFIVQATAVCILTLPTAASVAGKTFKIKNSIAAGGNVTLATTSSQTIDGALTRLVDKYQALTVVSDGTNWMVM